MLFKVRKIYKSVYLFKIKKFTRNLQLLQSARISYANCSDKTNFEQNLDKYFWHKAFHQEHLKKHQYLRN